MFYNEELVFKYLDKLCEEIKEKYQGEALKTIYIGGGTPSCLSVKALSKLMDICKIFKLGEDYEFTFECNPENITEEKIHLLKENGVNRISMGVESTNNKFLKYLGRHHDFEMVRKKVNLIKKQGINNINVDLIYALPNENIDDVKKDLDNLLSLDICHISTYSLEIHDNTILGIKKEENINEDLDCKMYDLICSKLEKNGFMHYEISNFAKKGKYSKHNIVYWKNESYYGFGLGAAGYINNVRYENTRSMYNYLKGNYLLNKEVLTKKDELSYALILGFRLINGIDKEDFKRQYGVELVDLYNIRELIKKGYLIDNGQNIKICDDKIYVENAILENFID